MLKPSTASSNIPIWLGRVLAWLSDHVTVVLTLAGIALYGGGRVALDAFYHPLGTSASEVGVSYLAIVALAGVSIGTNVIIYISLGAVVIALMYGLTAGLIRIFRQFRKPAYTYADYLEERQIEHEPLRTTIGFGIILIVSQVVFTWLASFPPLPPPWFEVGLSIFILLIAPVAYAIAVAITFTKPLLHSPIPPTSLITDLSRLLGGYRIRLLAIALPIILIGNTILAANQQGAEYAAQVKSGNEIQSDPHATVPFQAHCVILLPTTVETSPASKQLQAHKMLYLGQSSGVTVLYQVGVGSIRIPSGSYALKPVSGQCRG